VDQNYRQFLARNARRPHDGGAWDWRTIKLRLKEKIPDLNSESIAASNRAGGVEGGANRPTGAPHPALMTKKRA
jgi:hypothetical protein